MENRMNKNLWKFAAWILPGLCIGLCSCQKSESKELSAEDASQLVVAATATHAAYIRSLSPGQTASQVIPKECWANEIAALHPIRVYTHRANLVVVQRQIDTVEEGTYIVTLISSYLPTGGDDGFTYDPNPRNGNEYDLHQGVFHYTRTK
jgi:hypothetical protein